MSVGSSGGAILGGGGGGSAVTGAETGELAVRFSPLELTPLDQIDPETVIVTGLLVGAPAAQEKFVSPADMWRCDGAVYRAQEFGPVASSLTKMAVVLRSTVGWRHPCWEFPYWTPRATVVLTLQA